MSTQTDYSAVLAGNPHMIVLHASNSTTLTRVFGLPVGNFKATDPDSLSVDQLQRERERERKRESFT